jgi:ABC-type Mn2+/Zn2+ transport system ATPase subunit
VDIATQDATLELLSQLKEQQVTIIVSTHDLSLATGHFDQVLLLNHRLIAYGPPAQVITTQALSEAFGGRILILPGGVVVVDDCCRPEETGSGEVVAKRI